MKKLTIHEFFEMRRMNRTSVAAAVEITRKQKFEKRDFSDFEIPGTSKSEIVKKSAMLAKSATAVSY